MTYSKESNFPSVTEILSPFVDFSMIKPSVLKKASERGVRVHAACSAYSQGLWVAPLNEDEIRYFFSFKIWFNTLVDSVELSEPELESKKYGYCGHPDIILKIKGDKGLTLIDFKTPLSEQKTWKVQIAAYRQLAKEADYETKRGCSLRLKKDGSRAILSEYTDNDTDFNAFLGALTTYNYFKG